ncbi:MAG: hypothetical protein MI784_17430 [Cytophagales bacterium]|nr:hypothetical protein [Cytophagales bacterium]
MSAPALPIQPLMSKEHFQKISRPPGASGYSPATEAFLSKLENIIGTYNSKETAYRKVLDKTLDRTKEWETDNIHDRLALIHIMESSIYEFSKTTPFSSTGFSRNPLVLGLAELLRELQKDREQLAHKCITDKIGMSPPSIASIFSGYSLDRSSVNKDDAPKALWEALQKSRLINFDPAGLKPRRTSEATPLNNSDKKSISAEEKNTEAAFTGIIHQLLQYEGGQRLLEEVKNVYSKGRQKMINVIPIPHRPEASAPHITHHWESDGSHTIAFPFNIDAAQYYATQEQSSGFFKGKKKYYHYAPPFLLFAQALQEFLWMHQGFRPFTPMRLAGYNTLRKEFGLGQASSLKYYNLKHDEFELFLPAEDVSLDELEKSINPKAAGTQAADFDPSLLQSVSITTQTNLSDLQKTQKTKENEPQKTSSSSEDDFDNPLYHESPTDQ